MDYKAKKILEANVRQLKADWLATGKKRSDEKFFGLFTKKGMSIVLWVILVLVILADVGIFYQLHKIKQISGS
jgi:hypothetical protein